MKSSYSEEYISKLTLHPERWFLMLLLSGLKVICIRKDLSPV